MKVRGLAILVAGMMLAAGCGAADTVTPVVLGPTTPVTVEAPVVAPSPILSTATAVPAPSKKAAPKPQKAAPAPAKKQPAPVVKKKAEKRVEPASRSIGRYAVIPSGRGIASSARFHMGNWGRFSAAVERAALCVAKHESWGKMWWGQNPVSTASGFAQWINSTWRVNAKRAGVPVTARARYASPQNQAKVFAWMWTHGGKKAWRGTNCPGTW